MPFSEDFAMSAAQHDEGSSTLKSPKSYTKDSITRLSTELLIIVGMIAAICSVDFRKLVVQNQNQIPLVILGTEYEYGTRRPRCKRYPFLA